MKRERSFMVVAGEYMALAFILPASIFVGYAIGYLLDRWLGTKWLYLVFLIVGIIAGFRSLLRGINKLTTRDR